MLGMRETTTSSPSTLVRDKNVSRWEADEYGEGLEDTIGADR